MTTARKTPPRKAPTKKTAPRTRVEKVAAFEEFRRRAAGMSVAHGTRQVELGADQGFDPPLIARWPSTVAGEVLLDAAAGTGKPSAVLKELLGLPQLLRVTAMFEPLENSDDLFVGLTMYLWEQFIGPGASDVPGGTDASSTP